MIESQLSSIKTDINLAEVPPLNRRRVVAFVNCFLIRLTDSMNEFAARSERILMEAERQLRVTDTRLRLLEKKLASVVIDDTSTTARTDDASGSATPNPTIEVPEVKRTTDVKDSIDVEEKPTVSLAPPVEESDQGLKVKDDPVFAKYFKMLKMGVLEQAVRLKMQSEGVDPKYLDTPDAISPNCTVVRKEDQSPQVKDHSEEVPGDVSDSDDSVSSFSDSD